MFIDINKIGEEGLSFDHRLQLPDLEDASGAPIPTRDVHVAGTVERGARGAELFGRMEASVRLACSRCVEPFDAAVATDFFLTLVREQAGVPNEAAGGDDEDASFFHAPEGKADLRQIATEQIYLSLPLKPVCRDGCKGLCPTCGANRNRDECACSEDVLDPRLAPLRELKSKLSDS